LHPGLESTAPRWPTMRIDATGQFYPVATSGAIAMLRARRVRPARALFRARTPCAARARQAPDISRR
jgi:hypothetical protein